MASSSNTRASIKSRSPSEWKDKLRSECFTRLHAERDSLLERARLLRSSNAKDFLGKRAAPERNMVQEALRGIIDTSSKRMRGWEERHDKHEDSRGRADADMSGESQTTWVDVSPSDQRSRSATSFDAPCRRNIDDYDSLSPGEYAELMKAMEDSLYADLLQEEAEYLERLEQEDLEEMMETHFNELKLDSSDDATVLCPICQSGLLLQEHGVIACAHKDLRLDVSLEGISLTDLRSKLAEVISAHSVSGCKEHPIFRQKNHYGVSTLEMSCEPCGAFEVVL